MNELPADIQVVRGSPTDQELAAAIAVVQAALTAAEQESKHNANKVGDSSWNRNHSMLRRTISAGPGQWRASLRDGLN